MSLKSSVQCLLQTVSFHSIDLWTSGHHKLVISLASADESVAQPIHLIPDVASKPPEATPAHLEANQYHSRSFVLQYSNEVVQLGDVCVWKSELVARPGLESFSLIATLKLMYIESPPTAVASSPMIDMGQFRPVSEAAVKINFPMCGVHEFYKVAFDEGIYATVDLLVHTSTEEWAAVSSDNELTQALFPAIDTASDSHLEALCNDYLHPHISELHNLQVSIATLRPFIPFFDETYRSRLSQQIFTEPEIVRATKLNQQYFDYFYQNCRGNSSENTTMWLLHLMNYISAYISELGRVICELSIANMNELVAYYKEIYETKIGRMLEIVVFREKHVMDTVPLKNEKEIAEMHKQMARVRRSEAKLQDEGMMVEDGKKEKAKLAELPILFEDFYEVPNPQPSSSAPSTGLHLFVFIHGYGGCPSDLRNCANILTRKYSSNSFFLCVKSVQDNTDNDILLLGNLVSDEIKAYISDFCGGSLARLSLIGYSLGGVIARAALPHLEEFRDKMYTFLSLSSPHLGLMYSSSSLVDAGVWFFKSFKKSACMKQLTMSDSSDPTKTTLYKLSQHQGLRWFKRVILFSSYLDGYSPMESSRIELSKKAESSTSKGDIFVEMAGSLMSGLLPSRVTRVDVDFPLPGVSLDNLIGRKAHIEFISNMQFLTILSEKFPEAFS